MTRISSVTSSLTRILKHRKTSSWACLVLNFASSAKRSAASFASLKKKQKQDYLELLLKKAISSTFSAFICSFSSANWYLAD